MGHLDLTLVYRTASCRHDPRSSIKPVKEFGLTREITPLADRKASRALSQRDQSCRSLLATLAAQGKLLTVDREVDPVYDLSALLSLTHDTFAVQANRIKGYDLPVFGNLLSDLDRIALAMDVPRTEIQSALLGSIRNPIAPVVINNAPVQEKVFDTEVLAHLPVPTFFDKETGPYISAGLMIARDPETGLGNASYARLKILGPNEALIGIAPNHHLAIMARKAAEKGESLPFAVVLGAHPIIQLAACLYLGFGDDEMHCAGALFGEPVRMARCRTSDILVPAEAEIVLEGRIHADKPIVEGLVSEYHGMYEDYGSGVLATFHTMTSRADAMFQIIEPGYHGGIVDKQIEPAECLAHLRKEMLDLTRNGNIRRHNQDTLGHVLPFGSGGLENFPASAGDCYVISVFQKCRRDRLADPGSRAGNERNFNRSHCYFTPGWIVHWAP